MFLQPCFIRKNTPELRSKLERLGYKYTPNGVGEWFIPIESLDFICVNIYSNGKYIGENGYWNHSWIDCGTNEKLFIAIAALRNDTDKYQLFCNDKGEFFKCYENEFSHFRFDTNDILNIANAMELGTFPIGKPLVPYEDTKNWHKATVEELIEHFKYK